MGLPVSLSAFPPPVLAVLFLLLSFPFLDRFCLKQDSGGHGCVLPIASFRRQAGLPGQLLLLLPPTKRLL